MVKLELSVIKNRKYFKKYILNSMIQACTVQATRLIPPPTTCCSGWDSKNVGDLWTAF